jgi:hypothetical protein
MSGKNDWLWIEALFKRFSLPYPIICVIIGILIYIGYLFFSMMINILPLNFYAQLSAVSMSILIPFMLGGIQYLLNIMVKIIADLDILSHGQKSSTYESAKRRFTNSNWRFVFIICVVAPFYLVDWIPPISGTFLEHFKETYLPIYSIPKFHTIWGLSFDIYLQALGLFALLFLSYILWIMFNIIWTLDDWKDTCCSSPLESSIFNVKMKMASIKNSILKVLLFYFSCISLAIISYLNPTVFFSKETALLLILLLIGISFFILGIGAIQKALKSQVEHELEDVNKMSLEQVQRLKAITSNSHSEKDEISRISSLLDIFGKQRAEFEHMNTNMYDFRSVLRFVGMLILPFLSSIFKSAVDNSLLTSTIKEELISRINEVITWILNNKM